MYFAALYNHHESLTLLLEAGAGALVDTKMDVNGWTALAQAAQSGHMECVELLLAAGADVELRVQNEAIDVSPFELALGENNTGPWPRMFPVLLRAGATIPPDTQDPYLVRVRSAGGWGRYERACRARLAKPRELFPGLPTDTVSHVVHFAFTKPPRDKQTPRSKDTPTQKARPATCDRPTAAALSRLDHGRRRPAVDARRGGRVATPRQPRSLSPLVSTARVPQPDLMAGGPPPFQRRSPPPAAWRLNTAADELQHDLQRLAHVEVARDQLAANPLFRGLPAFSPPTPASRYPPRTAPGTSTAQTPPSAARHIAKQNRRPPGTGSRSWLAQAARSRATTCPRSTAQQHDLRRAGRREAHRVRGPRPRPDQHGSVVVGGVLLDIHRSQAPRGSGRGARWRGTSSVWVSLFRSINAASTISDSASLP